jgi:hypothetical protein
MSGYIYISPLVIYERVKFKGMWYRLLIGPSLRNNTLLSVDWPILFISNEYADLERCAYRPGKMCIKTCKDMLTDLEKYA